MEKRIGIAAPIEVASLKHFLDNLTTEDLELGLGGTAVNLIIEGLITNGYKVTVFTLDTTIKEQYILEGEKLKIIFGHFRVSKAKMVDFCFQEFKQIKSFIEQEKDTLSIVNAHWSYEFSIGTILAKVPHVITFRDDSPTILKLTKHPYRFVRLLMDFWVRAKGKAFTYNSIYLENLIKKKGLVIPNPIKIDRESVDSKFPELNEDFNIYFIANGWDHRKNPEIAIQAFEKVRAKFEKANLYLIGKGFEVDTEAYHKVKERFSLDGIHFIGFLKHEDLLDKMVDCNLMLHTSREESFGNNLIEAMAYGVPVMGGEMAGAVPWVLDYGKAGVLVDIENADDVAMAIEELLVNKNRYLELSQKGFLNVQTRFELDVVSKQYIEEYKRQIKIQN